MDGKFKLQICCFKDIETRDFPKTLLLKMNNHVLESK